MLIILGSVKPPHARASLNGEPVETNDGKDAPGGRMTVSHSTCYELVDRSTAGNSLLQIRADGPGLEAHAFTFGG